MIKDNQKYLNRMQVVLDGLVIMASYALAWYLRFKSGLMEVDEWYLPFEIYMRALTYIVPGYLFYMAVSRCIHQSEYREDGWKHGISHRLM